MFEKITNFIVTGEDKQDAMKEYENYIKNNKISECKIPQILYMSELDNKIKDSKLMLFYKEQVMNKDKEDIEKIQKNPSFVNKVLSLFKSNKKSYTINIQQELIKVAKDLQASEKLSDRACEIYGKINALGSQNAIPYFSKTREADKFQAKEYASDVEQQFKKVEQQVKKNERAAELFQTAFESGRRNAKDSIYLKNILHMYKWLSLI